MTSTRHVRGWTFLGFLCLTLLVAVGFGCDQTCSTSCDLDVPPIVFPGAQVSTDSLVAYVTFQVDPRGIPTTCDCLFGTTVAVADTAEATNIEASWGPRAVTVSFPLAQRDTTFYYACRAYNRVGVSVTPVDSFAFTPPNVLPLTTLSYTPEDGPDTGTLRVRMNWFGWDPDGWIDHFETRTVVDGDSSDWHVTVNTDSIFILTFDFDDYWRFSVRSVDNVGGIDPTPESITLFPRVSSAQGSVEERVLDWRSERPN